MSDEIRVSVVNRGRKYLYMRYIDPLSGRPVERSTGCQRRKEANKVAARWEGELREGRCRGASKITWTEFRQRYEAEVVPSFAERTDGKVAAAFNAVERFLPAVRDGKLSDLTSARLSKLASELRQLGRAEDTIQCHLAYLRAALNWARRVGLVHTVPEIDMPKRAKASRSSMKGRAIVAEEFERMLAAVPRALSSKTPRGSIREPAEAVLESYRHLLRGLWWSGLRLGEALNLCWNREDHLCVDLTGRRPMLWIPGELEKGHRDRLMPLAPEFAEFLLATPEAERTGYVFNPLPRRRRTPQNGRLRLDTVSSTILDIGEAANVKATDKNGKIKWASAHDLRRAFGFRWAMRVMPTVLKELMRHETIETTMKYYVGRNADATADVLWQAVSSQGDTSGDTDSISAFPSAHENAASPENSETCG